MFNVSQHLSKMAAKNAEFSNMTASPWLEDIT